MKALSGMCPWVFALLRLLALSAVAGAVFAEDLSPQAYLGRVFGQTLPPMQLRLLTAAEKTDLEAILQHRLASQRLRFWQQEKNSVWILDEIGKHKPITAAFWLQNGRIKEAKVLAFRESRGWEIKNPRFLAQYQGLSLTEAHQLSAPIDGISGATLSVRAMDKMARMALYLEKALRQQ